jgi:WhiB family redox-sensing transcriptional regulator
LNYSTQLDRAFVRQEAMETRDADAEAKRELWEITRKKEQARRQALLRQVRRGEIPIVGPAACTQISGDRAARVRVFFSQDRKVIDQAKAICAGCPRRESCLGGALERREPWGVWGGEQFRNGHVVTNRKRRPRHQLVRA